MTTALVTGATGFIGKFLVSYLLNHHTSVRVLVRKKQNFFPEYIEQHIGDLTQPESLTGAAEGIEVVYHLAGFAHAWKEHSHPESKHHAVNLQGVNHILKECVRARSKKFIFFSTIKAVGDTDNCIDEEWDSPPDSPYRKAKRAAEDIVLSIGQLHKMHVTVLRLSLVYGAGLKGNLYQMLRAIDKGYFLPIPLIKNKRSLVSIHDVCQAAWLVSQSEISNGKVYYVTDKEPYSTYSIYSDMCTALGKKISQWYIPLWLFKIFACIGNHGEKILRRRLPFNSQTFKKLFESAECSSMKIQKELNFCPEYSLNKLLPEIINVYRAEQQ